MTGCIYKRGDGRCDKPGKYMAFCIGEACSSQTPSNYDRIVSMTPKELAKWIDGKICPPRECPPTRCEECWLEWLQRPAEEGYND